MTLQRDYVVVVDLEATCWKNNVAPPGQQQEIIEIGVCKLDLQTLEPADKRSLLVKPTRSRVSEFCTGLTSLTQEQVDAGQDFAAACEVLRTDYGGPRHLWVSWGDYDRRMMHWQCDSFYVEYPFAQGAHLNLKQLYGDLRLGGKRKGMARALKNESLDMHGRHHRGHDDAWNTARLLAKLLQEDGAHILDACWKESA